MPSNPEIALFWRYIVSSLDRLVACLDNLSTAEINWRPLPTANSLYVLAIHTLANAEENLLGTLCGLPVARQRQAEFAAEGVSAEVIYQQWQSLRRHLKQHLVTLPTTALNELRQHPRRGVVTGRDLLIIVARHAAEHLGQAELTRDLLQATFEQPTNQGKKS